jgi:MATE family, multidrug efflux pump
MRIGALVAAVTVLTVWTLRGGIVHLYSRDPAVAAMALTLIPYLAAFHFFDALQTVASFVLRAYKLAMAPTVIHAAALWGWAWSAATSSPSAGSGDLRGASRACG